MATGHDHDRCIVLALDRAERLCAERGARLTPQRRRVLELVWHGHEAVKAYDIIRQMSSEDRTVKPPTVYRALGFLLAQGLIHRIESVNGYFGCPHPDEPHPNQLLVCSGCGRVEEIDAPAAAQALVAGADAQGFAIERQVVELRGKCRQCRN